MEEPETTPAKSQTAPANPQATPSEPPKAKRKQFGKPLWTLVIVIIALGAAMWLILPRLTFGGTDQTEQATTTLPDRLKKDFTLPPEAKAISAMESGSSVSATFSLPTTHTPTVWVETIATGSHFKKTKAHGVAPSLSDMNGGRHRRIRYDKVKDNYHASAEPFEMGPAGARGKP